MTTLALILVLVSAISHAVWNFLLKRCTNKEIFVWGLLVCIALVASPLAVVLLLIDPVEGPGWWFILVTSLLHALYFLFLGRSYTYGDLSSVYPVARGFAPALVPVLGILILGEKVSFIAAIGITSIVSGIATVYWWGKVKLVLQNPVGLLLDPATRFALLTGLVIAIYSVWDKVGVRYVNPFLYMYFMSLCTAFLLSPYILNKYGPRSVYLEWYKSKGSILSSGCLSFVSYGFILTALTISNVSYVAPAREIGIVVGILLGVFILKESFGLARIIGSSKIVLGLILIASGS